MLDKQPNFPALRRVVTGHDECRVAKVILDGEATNSRRSRPDARSTLVWSTDAMPADIALGQTVEDMGARRLGTQPSAGGTRFTVIDYAPGASGSMHRTETIDYVVVMSGEVEMDLDDSMVVLRTGDVLVQRGTHHAWVNRSGSPARVAFVLIDAKPLGIGHPRP